MFLFLHQFSIFSLSSLLNEKCAIDKAGIKHSPSFYHVHIALQEDCGLDHVPYEN